MSVIAQLLGFAYRVCLSRTVGAQVMGLYQLIMPVYAVLMSASSVGLTAAVSNGAARAAALGRGRLLRQTLGAGVRAFLWVMVPLAAAVAILYDPISVYFLGDARTQLGLLLLLPCALLTGVENVHKHFFYGVGRVRPPALVELGEQLLRAAAVLGLLAVFSTGDPERAVGLIVAGMIVCETFSAATLTALARRLLRRAGEGGASEERGRLPRRLLSIAVPIGLNALLGETLGAVNAAAVPRYLVLDGMAREAAMADFGALRGMTMPMLALPCIFLGAVHLVVMPRVARGSALGDAPGLRRDVERAMETVGAVVLPCMALMTVAGGETSMLLYREPLAGRYLAPLALATTCAAVASVPSGALSAAGHASVSAAIGVGCGAVQLILTAVAMRALGMGTAGFVLAVTASGLLHLILCLLAARRYLGLSLRPRRRTVICGLATLLCAWTAALLHAVLAGSGLPHAAVAAGTLGFGGTIYVCALAAMGWRGERKAK